MAVNPNVDFVSGAILLASQQNRFPRGIVAYAQAIANEGYGAEEIVLTSPSFTAVANRYYRVTFFEPALSPPAGSGATGVAKIHLTNIAGATLQTTTSTNATATFFLNPMVCQYVGTFTAGSTVVVGTLTASTSTGTAFRSATSPGFIMVEDIGPA